MQKFLRIFLIGTIFLILPQIVFADELLSERDFFIDSSYDLEKREKITAVLQTITSQLYFYIDSDWWEPLDIEKRKEVNIAITALTQEFENNIYPILTQNYGSEWKPGVDNDNKITILIHPMTEAASGYFNPGDEYPTAQVSTSNQREMVYLDANKITSSLNKSFLAHEFTHLITFNQKDKTYGVSEETWLNELRAEYAPTLAGYDNNYQGSYLQKRVNAFLENCSDSLTEWQGKASDYGVINLFAQYLADQYGKEILINSLKSKEIGITSLNSALRKNGFSEDFSKIFTNWTIAVFVNDCQVGPKYCYLSSNLKNFKITPFVYFLPVTGESTLRVGYLIKEWSGNWQKIVGGKQSIKLEFTGNSQANFKVPYIVEYDNASSTVGFMTLDQSQKGEIITKDQKVNSLIIIPLIQDKIADFSGNEPPFQFFWSASTEKIEGEENEIIQTLQERIKELENQITLLLAKITELSGGTSIICQNFNQDLYYGMRNNLDVNCLQEFLKSQGTEIYPEGLVTGNFLSLTQMAVIRFQEKYASEILKPLGLEKGTGYFGSLSRQKANQLIPK